MSADSDAKDAGPDGALSHRQQTRNMLIYTANWGLIYLASPVTYVGPLQAALCSRFGTPDWISNLPGSVYLFTTPLPVLVAWFFPQVRLLKRVLIAAYLAVAITGAAVAGALVVPMPSGLNPAYVVVSALCIHAAVLGCAGGVAAVNLWEMLGRTVPESRRGQVLGWAFGFGPILAVVASIGSQLILAGKFNGFAIPGVELFGRATARVEVPDLIVPAFDYPWNFALLFGASLPIMGLAAFLSSRFLVPLPAVDLTRQSFKEGVLDGFGAYFGYRLILLTVIGYILVYSGHMVMSNITLYTREAIGEAPEKYVGLQMALRFGFKVFAGFFLGWLLTRSNPKTLLVVTAFLSLAGVAWALTIPGFWFMLSFGIMGAGELFGVYYPNYILGCSPKSRMRRNMAFTSLVTMPVGFAGILYGAVSDTFGQTDKTFGFRMSFVVSLALLAATILVVLIGLPAQPRTPKEVSA